MNMRSQRDQALDDDLAEERFVASMGERAAEIWATIPIALVAAEPCPAHSAAVWQWCGFSTLGPFYCSARRTDAAIKAAELSPC